MDIMRMSRAENRIMASRDGRKVMASMLSTASPPPRILFLEWAMPILEDLDLEGEALWQALRERAPADINRLIDDLIRL